MTRPGFADAEDLIRFSDRFDAAAELPRLVRRLILETGHDIVRLGFRAGAGVRLGGWDGTVSAAKSTDHIPEGRSLWELSVADRVRQKADEDYDKRQDAPGNANPRDFAYVAVNSRRWGDKERWEEERRGQQRWGDVRFYDVDNLETWLETAPVTHSWISELVGLSPHGLRAAESWWDAWAAATDPPLPAGLVLAGREAAAEELKRRLQHQSPQLITLRGASQEDILAFVTAVVSNAAEGDGGDLLSRSVFVDQITAWRMLQNHKRPLVLVPLGEAATDPTSASVHHIVAPVIGPSAADIELPPIDPAKAADILKEIGLEERKAGEGGRLASFSLLALRRRLAAKPELLRPQWASPPVGSRVRRLLLSAQWNESKEADQEVVSRLVDEPYDRLREAVVGLAADEDPLLGSVGSSWALISPYDAWLLLRETIQPQDLDRLRTALEAVFLSVNPVLELPPEERWRASTVGKTPRYSADLRRGLATTLALLGALGGRVDAGGGSSGSDWVGYFVRDLLERANQDESGFLWASLEDTLPLLAEAAPGAFLDAIRDGLRGDPPLLQKLFMDTSDADAMSSDSPHTGLLWALEAVIWSPEHFGQAISLLGRLSEIDPGGRLANRPAASLDSILCPWLPQNSVGVANRLAAIDGLRERHPEVAWALMMELLPEQHAVTMPTHEPTFRDWKPAKMVVTRQEYLDFIGEIVRRLIEDAGRSPKRWAALIDRFSDTPPEARADVRARLRTVLDEGELPQAQQIELWEGLRDTITKHRRFEDADWALPADEVSDLEDLATRLKPNDPAVRHGWLFDEQMPDLPEKRGGDGLDEYMRRLAELRRDAIDEIGNASGWDGIREFAKERQFPWGMGVALADASPGRFEDELIAGLESEDPRQLEVAVAYFTRRFEADGWPALEPYLARDLSAIQQGRLLLSSRAYPESWERAKVLGRAVEETYWDDFRPIGLGSDFPHTLHVAEQLIEFKHYPTALDLLNLYARRDESGQFAELIATALERLNSEGASKAEMQRLDRYTFSWLFEYLQASDIDWQRLARLEWAYAAVLDFEHRLQTLERLISSDPSFFVDLVSRVYRPKAEQGKEHTPTSPDQERIAVNAYRVLSHWTRVPGLAEDGTVDSEELERWVDAARKQLIEADRVDIGDVHIGQVLAHAPADEGEDWPPRAVRDLLETLQTDKVEEGLLVGTLNSRGVTTRGLTDGGAQERDLVKGFREQATRLADRWPRSARILHRLADNYEREARRQDEDAERFSKGFER